MSDLESDLEAEVAFWRSMISECDLEPDSDEMKRMQEALAFTEFKLDGEKSKGKYKTTQNEISELVIVSNKKFKRGN